MNKKPTKADIYFIQKNPEGLDVTGLVKVTGLTNTQVNNILKKIPVVQAEQVPSKPGKTQFEKASITQTGKGRGGIFVMTEGASQIGDDSRGANKPKDTSSFICKAKK